MSTKRMTGFTHIHLPLVSDYSRVLHTQQDSLANITCMTGFTCGYSVVTHEYKSAQQELLSSIFNLSAITREQCTSCVARAQHKSYPQNVSKHKALLAFFVNLDVSCSYCIKTDLNLFMTCTTYTAYTRIHSQDQEMESNIFHVCDIFELFPYMQLTVL